MGHKLTARSRIAVRYTTDPMALGYADTQEQANRAVCRFLSSKPDHVGSPRTALEFAAETHRRIGINTYIRFAYQVCATGEIVEAETLRDVLREAEYKRWLRSQYGAYA